MPYDLTKEADRARLLRATAAYAQVGLYYGNAPTGREEAYAALQEALAAGYVLVPPISPEMLDAVGDAIGSATAHRGLSLLDSERLRLAREVTATARGGNGHAV